MQRNLTKHKQQAKSLEVLDSTKGLNDQNIENYEPEELNKILEDFHATVRKKDGKDYTSMAVFEQQLNVT